MRIVVTNNGRNEINKIEDLKLPLIDNNNNYNNKNNYNNSNHNNLNNNFIHFNLNKNRLNLFTRNYSIQNNNR